VKFLKANRWEYVLNWRQQMPGALESGGHQLRKETDESCEAQEVALAVHLAR